MDFEEFLNIKCTHASYFLKNMFQFWNTEDKSYLSETKKNIMFKLDIINNKILNNTNIKNCVDLIDEYLRIIFLLKKYSKRFILFFINKKEPINNTDLELNIIDTSKTYTINYIDYDEKKRFLFTLKDFKKLIKNNLEHSYNFDMIPQPIPIKNPYTNKQFTKKELSYFNSILYDMPIVWYMFVESDYSLSKLKSKYFLYLSEKCISSFVDQMEDNDAIFYLKNILSYFDINYCKKCIREKKHIRTNKIKNIITEWILSLKFNKFLNMDYCDKLSEIYSIQSCDHRPKLYVKRQNPFILTIDISKPLFCTGYHTDEDN